MSENTTETAPLNPADVEKQMLDQAEEAARNRDPQEVAATLFTLYLPRFLNNVDRLSNNALRRVLKSLIETPLSDTPYNFSSDMERETFAIAQALQDSKYLMIIGTYNEGLDKLSEAAGITEVPAETNNDLGTTNEGEVNG